MPETQQLTARLQSQYAGLAPAEQRVAAYVLENPEQVVDFSVTQLAKAVGIAEATVTRFCRSIGLRGYQDLKLRLARDMARGMTQTSSGLDHKDAINSGDGASSLARKLIYLSTQSLEATLQMLDSQSVEAAVTAIQNARRIGFYGMGESWPLCYIAQIRLAGLGKTAEAYLDSHMQAMTAALLGPGDVAFAISHMGVTKDVVESLQKAKTNGATIICLTAQGRSPVSDVSNIRLIYVAQDLTMEGWTLRSKTVQLLALDLIVTLLALRMRGEAWQARVTDAILDKLY